MADFEIKVSGLNDVKRKLQSVSPKLAERVQRLALRQGANYMAKAVRAAAPKKTGRLRRAIKVRNSKINRLGKNGTVGVFLTVAPGKSRKDPRGAWYGRFVELGYRRGSRSVTGAQAVASGQITRRQLMAAKLARGNRKGGLRYRAGGTAVEGQYFVRNTFESTKSQAARLIVEASKLAVERIVKEL